jgi:hypothetical protein
MPNAWIGGNIKKPLRLQPYGNSCLPARSLIQTVALVVVVRKLTHRVQNIHLGLLSAHLLCAKLPRSALAREGQLDYGSQPLRHHRPHPR